MPTRDLSDVTDEDEDEDKDESYLVMKVMIVKEVKRSDGL